MILMPFSVHYVPTLKCYHTIQSINSFQTKYVPIPIIHNKVKHSSFNKKNAYYLIFFTGIIIKQCR